MDQKRENNKGMVKKKQYIRSVEVIEFPLLVNRL